MPGPREDQTDLKLTEIALPLPAECGIKGIDHSTRCLKKKKNRCVVILPKCMSVRVYAVPM